MRHIRRYVRKGLQFKSMRFGATQIIVTAAISSFSLFYNIYNVSYAEVIVDGTMGSVQTINGPDYNITSGLGQIQGNNLFHSFSEFNINTNESANFSGPAHVDNIISRVTGSNPSWIDGSINSSIAGANLFFFNPNGVLFGANASINISGSFHVSTADYLRLGDGDTFNATLPQNSVLSVAQPSAFGFLDNTVASISFDQSQLQVLDGNNITVSGGDINIIGTTERRAELVAKSGTIKINSVSSSGEVSINQENDNNTLESFAQLGSIRVSNAWINTQGAMGGTLVIRGGQLQMNRSNAYSSTNNADADTDLSTRKDKGTIVKIRDTVQLSDFSRIGSNVFGVNAADSKGVDLSANRLVLSNGSNIESNVYTGSSGNSGGVTVNVNTLALDTNSYIRSNSEGSGQSGGLLLNANSVSLSNGSSLTALSFSSGIAGDITINSDQLLIDNAYVSTSSFGGADASDIHINSRTLTINGGGSRNSFMGLFANTLSSGDAGDINLNIEETFDADNYARIESSPVWAGSGNGGSITVNAGGITLSNASYISTSAIFGGGGNAGNITINSNSLTLKGLEQSDSPFQWDFTGIQTATGTAGGNGGTLIINTGDMTISNRGQINSASYGPGHGGDTNISANNIELLNGGQINTGGFGGGDSGDLSIQTDSLLISGVHPDRYPLFGDPGNLTLAASGIASQGGFGGGAGGDIHIIADKVEIADGARISTSTYGNGNGGLLHMETKQLNIHGKNQILYDFLRDIGNTDSEYRSRSALRAGSVSYYGNHSGNAGTIQLDVDNISLNMGVIEAYSDSDGRSGDLIINAQSLIMDNNSLISADSLGSGDTGDMHLNISDIRSNNSEITTKATLADGGNITISNNTWLYLNNSELTTSVAAENGNGGNIGIASDTLVLQDGHIKATAVSGNGGNININASRIIKTAASSIDASSQNAIDGHISIDLDIDLGSGLENKPVSSNQTALNITSECDVNKTENSSLAVSRNSFTYGINTGIPFSASIFVSRHKGNQTQVTAKTSNSVASKTANSQLTADRKQTDCMLKLTKNEKYTD